MKPYAALFMSALLALTFQGKDAHAAEGVTVPGPVGGVSFGAGSAPPPGLYITGVVATAPYVGRFDANGDKQFLGGGVQTTALSFMYSFPDEFMGGRVTAAIGLGVGFNNCVEVAGTPEVCGPDGLRDPYAEIGWSRYIPDKNKESYAGGARIPYGLSYRLGFGLTIPAGDFKQSDRLPDVGKNLWGFSPTVSMTYVRPSVLPPMFGEAIEVSGRLGYHIFSENDANRYQTGDVVSLEWAVGMHKGKWKYGLTGTTFKQLKVDKINGVIHPNDGNKAEGFNIGPIVTRNFQVNDRNINVAVKYQYRAKAKNQGNVPNLSIALTTKF